MDNGGQGSWWNGGAVGKKTLGWKLCLIHLTSSYSYRKQQKDKLREIRRKRKQQRIESAASEEGKAMLLDERFKSVESTRFEKKFRKRSATGTDDNNKEKRTQFKLGKAKVSKDTSATKKAANAKRKSKVKGSI